MDTTDSLTAFFYNFVPGVLFIFGVIYLFDYLYLFNKNEVIIIFFISVLGLFFGFLFQWFTKIARGDAFVINFFKDNEVLNSIVKKKNEEKEIYNMDYKQAINKLSGLIGYQRDKSDVKGNFYFMHNYLRAEGKAEVANYFTARLAFWSNLFFGSLFLVVLVVLKLFYFFYQYCNPNLTLNFDIKDNSSIVLLVSFCVLITSGIAFNKFLFILYDVILRTFITIVKTDNLNIERYKK